MQNRFRDLILLLLVFVATSLHAQGTAPNSGLEIFVEGNKVENLGMYRTERLKKFLQESLPLFGRREYPIFKKMLLKEFSAENLSSFSDEELSLIFEELYSNRPAEIIKDNPDNYMSEQDVKKMIEDFKKDKGIDEDKEIDATKMKTIIINK